MASQNEIMYRGVPISNLSADELRKAIAQLYSELEQSRKYSRQLFEKSYGGRHD